MQTARRLAPPRPCSADELRNNRQKICGPPDFVEEPAKAGFKVLELCTLVRQARAPPSRCCCRATARSATAVCAGACTGCSCALLAPHYVKAKCTGLGCRKQLRCFTDSSRVSPPAHRRALLLRMPLPPPPLPPPPAMLQPGLNPEDTFVNATFRFKNSCSGGSPETELREEVLVKQCPGQDPLLQPWAADSVSVAVQARPANCECTAACRWCCRWRHLSVSARPHLQC